MALLKAKTHNGVLRIVKSHCANFAKGGCILNDTKCDYFTACGGSISCDYFEQAVLPNDPLLQEQYRTQHGINYVDDKPFTGKLANCKTCGDEFFKGSNRALYCTHCREVKQREQNRNHMRKERGI